MKIAYQNTPSLVPQVYFYDSQRTLTIMQYLDPPHIILRKGLLQGTFSHLSSHFRNRLPKIRRIHF